MGKKMRMKDLSSITPIGCIFEHTYWTFILFINYTCLLFIPLDGFSVEKSKLILILCMVIASVIGTAIRWKKFMTSRGVLADIVIGLGIYTILAYREYYSGWIKKILIVFLVLSIAYCVYIFTRKSRGQILTEIKNKYRKRIVIKSRILRTLNMSGLILGALMTVFMVPISFIRIFYGGIMVSDAKYSSTRGFDNNYLENEFSLSNNINSISKIRFKSQWDPLTTSEKLNVLQDICNCELNYWGMDFEVTVVMDDLEERTLGSYCDFERCITIDKQHLENDNPEEILETVLHETYHSWEHCLLRLYLSSSESQRKMRVFQHCEEYIKEMMNYQDGGDDYESFMSYFCQYMERDSCSYAARAVRAYYDQIDLILEEQNSKNTEGKEGAMNE